MENVKDGIEAMIANMTGKRNLNPWSYHGAWSQGINKSNDIDGVIHHGQGKTQRVDLSFAGDIICKSRAHVMHWALPVMDLLVNVDLLRWMGFTMRWDFADLGFVSGGGMGAMNFTYKVCVDQWFGATCVIFKIKKKKKNSCQIW